MIRKKNMVTLLVAFVALMVVGGQPGYSVEAEYLQDLPELTHPALFKWKFESEGAPMGRAAAYNEDTEELDLQEKTHPALFDWRFGPSAGSVSVSGGVDSDMEELDLQELTHPYLFRWRFAEPAPEVEDVVDASAVKEEPKPVEEEEEEEVIPERPTAQAEWISLPEQTVYFAYDRSHLRPPARQKIQENVDYLKEHPSYNILIEGHCDERGTQEYNLALGERRANSIRDYMVELGIDADRITTKSWGEELPVALGHNEAAWSQNRRGEMYYSQPNQ